MTFSTCERAGVSCKRGYFAGLYIKAPSRVPSEAPAALPPPMDSGAELVTRGGAPRLSVFPAARAAGADVSVWMRHLC